MFNKQNLFAKPAGSTTPERRPTYPNTLAGRGAPSHSGPSTSAVASSPSSESRDVSQTQENTAMTDIENTTADTETKGSQLIVGPDVKLKGAEILDCDTLVVEGRVEATMDSRVIRIADKGSFSGKVCIDVAEVHGHFEGELTARKQLIIHATGKVSGVIRYGKILIEEGGIVSGDVQSINAEEAAKTTARIQPLVANKG